MKVIFFFFFLSKINKKVEKELTSPKLSGTIIKFLTIGASNFHTKSDLCATDAEPLKLMKYVHSPPPPKMLQLYHCACGPANS